MTLTNSIVAKLAVAFVAVAMALSVVAPARAQTIDELNAQIAALMAQITALQAQAGGGAAVASAVCPYTWSRNLSIGDSGPDVMKLQQFLNSNPATRVAATGVGSAGQETEYYGALTGAAVAKFQEMYRADILSPLGLVNSTTYFGNMTRAKANELCSVAPAPSPVDDVVDDVTDDVTDDDVVADDDDDDNTLHGGEADVNSFTFRDEESDIAEGQEDRPVYRIEFDVEDGDVRLERMDVTLDSTAIVGGNGEPDPWDAFDEMSIWVDGEKVASEDTSNEDDWDENTGDEYVFRITNIDTIFREDTTGEVIVALSANNSVDTDGGAGNDDWDIFIDTDGMRFVDSEGIDTFGPPSGSVDRTTFEMIDQGDNDDLDLDSSPEDPDATTFEVNEDNNMEHMIFAYELSAEDSDNDIDIDNLYIDVTVGSPNTSYDTLDELVDDFRIEIDGDSYDAESYTGTGRHAKLQFDVDNDSTVKHDESATVKLFADFNDVTSSFTVATITASTTRSASYIDASGADDLTTSQIGGANRIGETHTLRLQGLKFAAKPSDGTGDGDATQVVDPNNKSDNYGTFFLDFDITVFGDDLWVPVNSVSRGASTTAGVAFQIENAQTGAAVTTGTTTATFDIDGANEDNGYFELEEGNTYTGQLKITAFDPSTSGTYLLQLLSVGYNATEDTAPDTTQAPDDLDDYESDDVQILS